MKVLWILVAIVLLRTDAYFVKLTSPPMLGFTNDQGSSFKGYYKGRVFGKQHDDAIVYFKMANKFHYKDFYIVNDEFIWLNLVPDIKPRATSIYPTSAVVVEYPVTTMAWYPSVVWMTRQAGTQMSYYVGVWKEGEEHTVKDWVKRDLRPFWISDLNKIRLAGLHPKYWCENLQHGCTAAEKCVVVGNLPPILKCIDRKKATTASPLTTTLQPTTTLLPGTTTTTQPTTHGTRFFDSLVTKPTKTQTRLQKLKKRKSVTSTKTKDNDSNSLPGIIGGIFGGLVFVVLICGVIYWLRLGKHPFLHPKDVEANKAGDGTEVERKDIKKGFKEDEKKVKKKHGQPGKEGKHNEHHRKEKDGHRHGHRSKTKRDGENSERKRKRRREHHGKSESAKGKRETTEEN